MCLVPGIVLSVIAALAKQERQTLIDRTMAGLRTAKRSGKILGRPRRAIDWEGRGLFSKEHIGGY